jgi:23S rRNA (adenine2030-N6)-methyltransferase
MNYRHAYHAGNFADCFKHALLVEIVQSIARKASPFFVLDTHAGAGRYDLNSEQARRTGEADRGIRRLMERRPAGLDHYLDLVGKLGLYPGSPALIQALLRPGDRAGCCELHPDEVLSLRRLFRDDPRVTVHHRSGWEALGALLPPAERRGLVLIDPPFEEIDEFHKLADGLARGYRQFAHGVFAAWYPIKGLSSPRAFLENVRARPIRDVVSVQLHIREPVDPSRLNGCGLLVVNPPYRFAERAGQIAQAVLDGCGLAEPGAGSVTDRISSE